MNLMLNHSMKETEQMKDRNEWGREKEIERALEFNENARKLRFGSFNLQWTVYGIVCGDNSNNKNNNLVKSFPIQSIAFETNI